MREYRFQATNETTEALRRLRTPWLGFTIGELAFTVHLVDGDTVQVAVDTVDVEGVFDAYRLSAVRITERMPLPLLLEDAGGFGAGGNDVVLFTGASWSEPEGSAVASQFGEKAVLQFSGHIGQLSDTAEIVCITTDAFVVATAGGEGLLVRTGLKPESVEVVRNKTKVQAFLLERGYISEE